MTRLVTYYEIVISTYHGRPMGRLRFEGEETSWFWMSELNEILEHWRQDRLLGTFAIGTRLAPDARFKLVEKQDENS